MQTIEASFLTGLGLAGEIRINVQGHRFTVPVTLDNVEGKYELFHQTWTLMRNILGLEAGMALVFTKEQNNELWMMAFNRDGSSYTNAHFFGATQLRLIQPKVPHEDEGAIYFFIT